MTRRILLSAFACDPFFGSDEEVGWQWALQLSRAGHEVTVITRRSHQAAIEQQVAATGDCRAVQFAYVDLPRVHRLLRRINRRNHLYYYLWQWSAWRRAAAMHAVHAFDLVQHVTWVSFRQPSFMGRLGIPFVFGPVAGGDEIPPGYARRFSWRERLVEHLRTGLNRLVRFDPLMRQTYRQAARVVFTSPAHLDRVPGFVRVKARVDLGIGVSGQAALPDGAARDPSRLIFVGRMIGLKGLDLGLDIFARALARRPSLRLTLVGDGPERARWQAKAQRLGVDHALDWRGWLPKDQVQQLYADHGLLFYPSLRDSGGFVVLEALEAGLPVVCFKLGGPGVVVDATVGAAIEPLADIERTCELFAEQVLQTLDSLAVAPGAPEICAARARQFTWPALCARVLDGVTEGCRPS